MLTNTSKRDKENTNFDELPKMNSRIKITTIKIMRFGTKSLKCTFKILNQEVLGYLQKFGKDKNKTFCSYICLCLINRSIFWLQSCQYDLLGCNQLRDLSAYKRRVWY